MECFERSYADEHPLALEVDVGDGELVGERHDGGSRKVSVWAYSLAVGKSWSSPVDVCMTIVEI